MIQKSHVTTNIWWIKSECWWFNINKIFNPQKRFGSKQRKSLLCGSLSFILKSKVCNRNIWRSWISLYVNFFLIGWHIDKKLKLHLKPVHLSKELPSPRYKFPWRKNQYLQLIFTYACGLCFCFNCAFINLFKLSRTSRQDCITRLTSKYHNKRWLSLFHCRNRNYHF